MNDERPGDGTFLRLYDSTGQLRLTRAEDEARGKAFERERAEDATRRADKVTRLTEAEAQRNKALEEKLRSLGIDPDSI